MLRRMSIFAAVLSIFGGFLGVPEAIKPDAHWLGQFLEPVVGSAPREVSGGTEWGVMGVSVLVALVGTLWAVGRFSKRPELGEPTGFGKVLANKWYVDEFYNAVIVKPIDLLAQFLVSRTNRVWQNIRRTAKALGQPALHIRR